ncbi:MAG: class I SAM-dependent methyltransferase [Anaerolineales bacterium]
MTQNPTRWYDRIAFLYDPFILGVYNRARRVTAEHLRLEPGHRVLDLACGTGENFRYILPEIGPSGVLVGADYSQGMLAQARRKVSRAGWENVHLLHADAQMITLDEISTAASLPAQPFDFAQDRPFDRVLITLGLTVIPDWQAAFERAWGMLTPGGRMTLMDGHVPERTWWTPIVDAIAASDIQRHWWEPLEARVDDFAKVRLFPGMIYVVSGSK